MSEYTINEVAKITGIKAHTLRIWEKRYTLLNPGRTASNIRFYNDDDVELLIHVSELKNKGMRISEIAEFSPEEIKKKVLGENKKSQVDLSDKLLDPIIQLDEQKFEEQFKSLVERKGLHHCMTEVFYPLINKLSVLYIAGSIKPSQEHFLYSILSNCIQGCIYQLNSGGPLIEPSFLLYDNGDNHHSIYLKHMNYLIKNAGFKSLCLQRYPEIDQLKEVYKIKKPEYIFFVMSGNDNNESAFNRLKNLSTTFDKSSLLIYGFESFQNQRLSFNNIRFLNNMSDCKKFLEHLI